MSGNRGKSSFETMDTIDTGVSPEKSNLSKVDIKRGAKDISVDLDPISKINKGFTDCDDSLVVEKGMYPSTKTAIGAGLAGIGVGTIGGYKAGKKMESKKHDPAYKQRADYSQHMLKENDPLPYDEWEKKNPINKYKSLDDSLVIEKGVRENLGKIMDAGSRVSERAMQNRHIYPDKAERYDKAAKKLFGKFDELRATHEMKEVDDSLVVEKGFLTNAFKRVAKPFRNEANVVPNDLKTGLDRVSRANRVNTTLARNGSGPAKNTIMAQRQAAGKHLTGLRPQARIARGSTIPQEPNAIDFRNKGFIDCEESLVVEKGVKSGLQKIGQWSRNHPVSAGTALTGVSLGAMTGGTIGHNIGKKESDKKNKYKADIAFADGREEGFTEAFDIKDKDKKKYMGYNDPYYKSFDESMVVEKVMKEE